MDYLSKEQRMFRSNVNPYAEKIKKEEENKWYLWAWVVCGIVATVLCMPAIITFYSLIK